MVLICQPIYKPGSVITSHLSSPSVATRVKRIICRTPWRDTSLKRQRCTTLQQTGFTTHPCHHG